MEKYTYWLLLLGSLAFPLSFSFEKRISFFRTWKYLFPAISITALFFILWDHYFTINGVWSFNEKYITGIKIYSLPIEEILFFIIIPYCCVFIYESLNFLIPNSISKSYINIINLVLLLFFISIAFTHLDKAYTFYTSFFASIYLAIIILMKVNYMAKFYRAYIVSQIPFFIVNGLLTSLPVVMYNDSENLGIRITTIPIDDTIYSFLLLLMTISLMEFFRKKQLSISFLRTK